MEDICIPPYLGSDKMDDFNVLMRVLGGLRPALLVELGTAYGNLSANICNQFPEIQIVTVNAPVETQTGNVVTYQISRQEIGRVYRKWGFHDRVTQVFANTLSLNLGKILSQESADAAIVDACHDTEYVINDFYKVEPYVRTGGIILFHDVHPSRTGHLNGAYCACVELRRRGYSISHISGTWWGLYVKGGEMIPNASGNFNARANIA